MHMPVLIVASLTALLAFPAPAQQSVPDAPQPQKKQNAAPPDPAPPPADSTPPNSTPSSAKDDNAFPEDVSKKAAKAAEAAGESKTPDNAGQNPFPEEQSKAAAKAVGNDPSPGEPKVAVHDPARSRKDDEVGGFYLKKGDYRGALLRYQDAAAADPTNVNAIFGLAETQHMLKKNADAIRNYELYLDIVPDGPKAKQALKALKELQAGK